MADAGKNMILPIFLRLGRKIALFPPDSCGYDVDQQLTTSSIMRLLLEQLKQRLPTHTCAALTRSKKKPRDSSQTSPHSSLKSPGLHRMTSLSVSYTFRSMTSAIPRYNLKHLFQFSNTRRQLRQSNVFAALCTTESDLAVLMQFLFVYSSSFLKQNFFYTVFLK